MFSCYCCCTNTCCANCSCCTDTCNSERSFQARNSKGYEVELLAAPSVCADMPTDELLSPLPDMPEQEWLLKGTLVSQIVCAADKSPAPIVAPDPRWMALHKLWLAQKKTRNNLKKEKDHKQGIALLTCVRDYMPHFPLDKDFIESMPSELIPHFVQWRANVPPKPDGWDD